MTGTVRLSLLFFLLISSFASSFSVRPITHILQRKQATLSPILNLRGGTQLEAIMTGPIPLIISSLESGPYGVVAMTAIASAVCIPATQYKNLYGISVGYGLSVAAIALALRKIFVITPLAVGDVLTGAALFYGLRLALYLFIRDVSGGKPLSTNGEMARLKRIPVAISLALFYALMTTPLLYALRSPAAAAVTWKIRTAWAGTAFAWAGATLEAIADAQKFIVKLNSKGKTAFRGPSTGVYALTRHPNYTGEVVFWFGVWLAGLPSFEKSVIAWLCSSAGLYGIISIMRGATKSLEKRHTEKYGGQPKYETWKKDVPAPLFPFVKG